MTIQRERIEKAYSSYAGVYDRVFGRVFQDSRETVVRNLKITPGERVLEVGVGTGLSLPMYPSYVRITGVDASREMLGKARLRVAAGNITNVEALLEMDAQAMSFADASFDKVVAMYVVSVVERPAQLMRELRRVCRPGGEIFIVNHVRSDNPLVGAVEKSLARFSDKLGFHPDFDLADLVERHELTQVSRINFFWKVMRLHNGHNGARRLGASPAAAGETGTAPR